MAMRVGKETYYMAAIYLAPFYLLVCVYILLRSLHWFQVLHTVFRNVWVCRGIGLVYLFVVFSILIAFMAAASGFRRFMKLLSNYWLGVLMYTLMTLGIADGLRLLLKYPLRNLGFPGRELLFSNMGTAVVGAVCAVIISTVSIYGVLRLLYTSDADDECTRLLDGGSSNMYKIHSQCLLSVSDLYQLMS